MSSQKIEVQKLQQSNYEQLVDAMKAAYSNWGGSVWSERAIKKLLAVFPEGQLIVMADDQVVGCALSIRVKYDDFGDEHTYNQITGNYSFRPTTPTGMCCTELKCLFTPISGECVWVVVCTIHAKNCAKNST